MHAITHAGLGWFLANIGDEDRRFRGSVLLASIIPDIDGITVFLGLTSYDQYHHLFCHNLLFSLAVSLISVWFAKKRRIKTFIFTQLAFYTHYFGDYFFTRYPLYYFWPFSDKAYLSPHGVWIGHPVNYIFCLLALLYFVYIAAKYGRTPIEPFHPILDLRLVNTCFRRKPLSCSFCGRSTNEFCSHCNSSVCKHCAIIDKNFEIFCSSCFEIR
ncbi:MAG: metal-dependent hydrolase [bacterium]